MQRKLKDAGDNDASADGQEGAGMVRPAFSIDKMQHLLTFIKVDSVPVNDGDGPLSPSLEVNPDTYTPLRSTHRGNQGAEPNDSTGEGKVDMPTSMSTVSLVAVLGSPAPALSGDTDAQNSRDAFIQSAVRSVVFVPWCVLIGGAILLSPGHLPRLASPSCIFTPPIPRPGIKRFAYWAECAFYHVFIFLAFVVAILAYATPIGLFLTFVTVVGSIWRWYGFKMDDETHGVRLGEDDWQSCYLVATKIYMKEESMLVAPSRALDEAASSGVGAHNAGFI